MSSEEKHEYDFTWRIENYSANFHKLGDGIQSPTFVTHDLCGSRWFLDFYPAGYDDENTYVACFLNWIDSDERIDTTSLDFCIDILSEKDCVLASSNFSSRHFEETENAWGWDKLFHIQDLAKEMDKWENDILTLRCRILSNKKNEQTSLGSEGSTKIIVDRCISEWNVKLPVLYEFSRSISFSFSELNQFEIILTYIPESLSIYLCPKDNKSDDLPVRMTFKITIRDNTEFKLSSKRAVHFFDTTEKWQFPDFITKKVLEACKIDSFQCGFKLVCEAYTSKRTISHDYIVKDPSPIVSENKPKDEIALQTEFRSIFISKKDSDVTIRASNKDFPAHKFILKVRSPVFAAMFDQGMLETQTGVVDIKDMDGKTLEIFLGFLYTETVDKMDYDIAKKLMLAADKYQVASLLDECASYLKSILSVDNVSEIIMIADLVNSESLKSRSLNFIKMNAEKILPTVAWTQLIEENIKLGTYILSELSILIRTEYKFR